MKPAKPLKNAHTSNSKFGMGDNYGRGVKQKIGRVREGIGMVPLSKKKIGTPPKSVC
jgi:hypothetical protein